MNAPTTRTPEKVAEAASPPQAATAVARDACHLLFIGRGEFMAFFGERPEAMSRIIELLCARLRRICLRRK